MSQEIAPLLASLQQLATAQDQLIANQGAMLNRAFDLHNALTDWATNTDQGHAAAEVMDILDQYVLGPRTVIVPIEIVASPQAFSPDTVS